MTTPCNHPTLDSCRNCIHQEHCDSVQLDDEPAQLRCLHCDSDLRLDATNQFCMLCGGEWTHELPCTCPAESSGDRYMLHGVLARLTAVKLYPTDHTDEEAMAEWSDEHDSRWNVYAQHLETLTRELIATLTAYLSQG